MEYQLDTRNYRCPLPLLMTKKALVKLAENDVLTVLISSESSIEEFRLLCEESHCTLTFCEKGRALKICK